jgi:hypothetical protein
MYPGPALGGCCIAATPPSVATSSHRCSWADHDKPSLHATIRTDPSSATDVRRPVVADRVSILDAAQHDDTQDAVLTYRVGCQLQCVKPHHT